jgi:hypothetical protein
MAAFGTHDLMIMICDHRAVGSRTCLGMVDLGRILVPENLFVMAIGVASLGSRKVRE